SFYKEESAIREMFGFPPFRHLVKVAFSGTDEKKTYAIAEQLRIQALQKLSNDNEINPVLPSGHAKVKDRFRFQFFIRGPAIYAIIQALHAATSKVKIPSSIRLHVDVNPLSTFF